MNNPRLTKKDRALVAGAIRRVFSRSELRKLILSKTIVPGHRDASRPRVKTWCRCQECHKLEAVSGMQVDHISPVVPLDLSLDNMLISELGWEKLIDRIWCSEFNLQAICISCHLVKSKAEAKLRKRNRKKGA